MQRWLAPVAILTLVVAGCADDPAAGPGDEDPLTPPGTLCPTPRTTNAQPGATAAVPLPLREGFEAEAAASSSPLPRKATDGTWAVQADPDAPEGGSVLLGQGDVDPGFSALLFPAAGEPGDLSLDVAFSIGCVEHPHGVGVVLHVEDAKDYQIVRYSASENGWDFFTVRGGERVKQDAARVGDGTDPEPGAWTRLRVQSEAGRVRAYDGETLVLDFQLTPEDSAVGQAGLFLRGSSDARFDDVRIDLPMVPLPA